MSANEKPGSRRSDPGTTAPVVYIGSTSGMEQRIVANESHLPYRAVPAAALRGRNPLVLARNATTLVAGTLAARVLLRELRPAAILGTGGYVCVPVFLAARQLGIPTLVYLPDVVPGLAVKMLSRIATRTACSTDDSRRHLPQRSRAGHELLVTGYPVRAELAALGTQQQPRAACRAAFGIHNDNNDDADADSPVLIVYGGSRGARSINRAVEALLPDLLALAHVIHVCGREGDETWLQSRADQLETRLRERYRLYPYLESSHSGRMEQGNTHTPTMLDALGAADLALCRSGASILGELPILGLPAVLIPYPYVHQDENADYLVRHGAAVKIPDAALVGEGPPKEGALATWLHRLLQTDSEERLHMAERSRALARPDAAQHLADALQHLVAGS